MAQFSGFDPTLKVKHVFDFRMFDVPNWVACLTRDNGPGGTPSLEPPFQFHLKEHWRYPQSLRSLLPGTESFFFTSPRVVASHSNVIKGADLYPKTTRSISLQTPQTKAGALT